MLYGKAGGFAAVVCGGCGATCERRRGFTVLAGAVRLGYCAVSVAAVVLAAGASTRLGEAKQLVMLGGETLLERAVRVAREAGGLPVVVVVGAHSVQVLGSSALGDAVLVINEEWKEGMASSIRLGVRALESARDVE